MFKVGEKLSRIERLLLEQNGLLRELLLTLGHRPQTPRIGVQQFVTERTTPRTDKDVFQVTRQSVIDREREAEAARQAPWRSGPDSAEMGPMSGDASSPTSGSPNATKR